MLVRNVKRVIRRKDANAVVKKGIMRNHVESLCSKDLPRNSGWTISRNTTSGLLFKVIVTECGV